MSINRSISNGFVWNLLERFGVLGIQFVLQIVLARLLDPEHYGMLSLMVIFTTLASVFVQKGFSSALIQNKDVTENDYSSVFWLSFAVAVLIYILMFLSAPFIAAYYNMHDLIAPFRVLSLILLPGAFNSVQLAKISREMDFKKVFFSNIAAVVVAGISGIVVAILGGGLWALVVQSLLNVVVASIVMWHTVSWKPRLIFDLNRVKVLFSFGWKILVSNLLSTLYQDLSSLVIARKYSGSTLGYYNRGKHFPQFLMNAINTSVQAVMLPAMSASQSEQNRVKRLTRHSIMLSSYVVFPMMAGLAAVAKPLISLILTDKWLPSVPFMQAYCFVFAFYPVHSCNLQAINAIGRSDIFLKLEVIKKAIGLVSLIIAVGVFDSPLIIAFSSAFTTIISFFINAYPNKRLINYTYLEQIKDILPSLFACLLMLLGVVAVGNVGIGPFQTMVLQILTGFVLYIAISKIMNMKPYNLILDMVKRHFKLAKGKK